jgi:hypothetical protein
MRRHAICGAFPAHIRAHPTGDVKMITLEGHATIGRLETLSPEEAWQERYQVLLLMLRVLYLPECCEAANLLERERSLIPELDYVGHRLHALDPDNW